MDETITNNEKYVLVDWPFAKSIEEFTLFYNTTVKSHKPLAILFPYANEFALSKINTYIQNNLLGKVIQFCIKTDGGLYQKGASALYIVEKLFGKIESMKANDIQNITQDLFGYFWIKTQSIQGVMINSHTMNFPFFEFEILFENGRICIDGEKKLITISQVNSKNRLKVFETISLKHKQNIKYLTRKILPHQSYDQTKELLYFAYKMLKIRNSFLLNDRRQS